VISSVLAGGGATAALLELELELLELELLELDLLLEPELLPELELAVPHGSMATVCVRALVGIVTTFDPGGILLEPDCTVAASEHEVTASVNGLCCLGMTTVLTPGVCSALDTGFTLELELELELLPPLLPQPASASSSPAHEMDAVTSRETPARFMFPPAWLVEFECASYTSALTLTRLLLTLRLPWR
jgi:hypothetical protein